MKSENFSCFVIPAAFFETNERKASQNSKQIFITELNIWIIYKEWSETKVFSVNFAVDFRLIDLATR
jgi:hypothetical protein